MEGEASKQIVSSEPKKKVRIVRRKNVGATTKEVATQGKGKKSAVVP
jgi:hypothetical protein